MNHAELKNYAPQARRDFIQAVTDRAAFYGVTAAGSKPATVSGDVAIIAGHAFPASVVPKRKKLEDRIKESGFDQAMEALAYTWFNRFVAIRFMELHGYLEHGYRVLSHPDPAKTIPEILELAEHVDLPGLNREKVIDLKLAGNKEPELYRMLLLAQCHALNSAMPFLFEAIDNETELVLPENLLHSDSIIRKLVGASIPEDWQEVEVLGWLYQYYISERKDEVMARKSAVPKEDIPAVTQLFTPHWIVRYLVENSLGRLWLLNRPGSRLREHMPYYIEGESETDFLRITKPEEIRVLDPACGSGHMLTYAFDLLFFIYTEEGYIPDEIPALILRRNLRGLEICPRAAQLTNLALVFKACEKSRQFFQAENLVRPNVVELHEIRFEQTELRDYIHALNLGAVFDEPALRQMDQFEEAKSFGSLIQPCIGEKTIAIIRGTIESKDIGSHLFLRETHLKVLRALEQAETLSQRYHVVIANPPYMGAKFYNTKLKQFVEDFYRTGQPDTYGCFMQRNINFAEHGGFVGMITIPNWMFISSFDNLREFLLSNVLISSLVYCGRGVWGPDFGSCAFSLHTRSDPHAPGVFRRLFRRLGEVNSNDELMLRFNDRLAFPEFHCCSGDFKDIPHKRLAFWISPDERSKYAHGDTFEKRADTRKGLDTGENDRFLRFWHEVSMHKFSPTGQSASKWFPYNKGGDFRKWYGNRDTIINWEDGGAAIKAGLNNRRKKPTIRNQDYYFRESFTWSTVTISRFSARYSPPGAVFDNGGCSAFARDDTFPINLIGGLLNSNVAHRYLEFLAPTVNYQPGDVGDILLPASLVRHKSAITSDVAECVAIARTDWDNFESSWGFCDSPLLRPCLKGATLEASWDNWEAHCKSTIRHMQELETENNRLFIDAYALQDKLSPEVPEDQVTLARADARRDTAAFLSYVVGCMMGRYSLDKPGLILADAGDSLTEYIEKLGKPPDTIAFAPNEDGIIPVLDTEWFAGDIVARTRDFLRVTFGEATLESNVQFIEQSLGKELRRYFLTDFYKDHLQTYKKRPIYWLFSSGKERAFQALVYLHRYREGTLSRMRTEYVIPLQGRIGSRIDQLAGDILKAGSTSHRKKLEKERDALLRQRTELQAFDEKLRHFADQRIQLDLDDGVKVNYGKLGDLLAEVKAVIGGSDE
jgi:hypothetical protein